MATHTPGPWTVGTSSDTGGNVVDCIISHAAGGIVIASGIDPETGDAFLMAAAPELLEALQKIREIGTMITIGNPADHAINRIMDTAINAIAKATGK